MGSLLRKQNRKDDRSIMINELILAKLNELTVDEREVALILMRILDDPTSSKEIHVITEKVLDELSSILEDKK